MKEKAYKTQTLWFKAEKNKVFMTKLKKMFGNANAEYPENVKKR